MEDPDSLFNPDAPTLKFDVSGQICFAASISRANRNARAERVAEELVALSGVETAPADALCTRVVLDIEPAEGLVSHKGLESFLSSLLKPPVLFAFDVKTSVAVSGSEFSRNNWVPDKDLARTLRNVAVGRLNEAIGLVCICSVLASPGVGWFAAEYPDERSEWLDAVRAHSLESVFSTIERVGWPLFRELSLHDVYSWVVGLSGWMHGVGEDRAGRAFAAFTQIVGAPDSRQPGDDLTRATAGLEALFASGRYRRMAQAVEGVQRLLGASPEAAAEFVSNYNHRSRMVHGELPLPFQFRSRGNYEEMRTIWDADEAGRLAIAMLTASLQELVSRGEYPAPT